MKSEYMKQLISPFRILYIQSSSYALKANARTNFP